MRISGQSSPLLRWCDERIGEVLNSSKEDLRRIELNLARQSRNALLVVSLRRIKRAVQDPVRVGIEVLTHVAHVDVEGRIAVAGTKILLHREEQVSPPVVIDDSAALILVLTQRLTDGVGAIAVGHLALPDAGSLDALEASGELETSNFEAHVAEAADDSIGKGDLNGGNLCGHDLAIAQVDGLGDFVDIGLGRHGNNYRQDARGQHIS